MKAVLAIDQGTTGTRAIIFAGDGQLLASSYQEFPQYFPQPGWVEHDAEEIWNSVQATVRQALVDAGLGATELGAIGITNQRETTVLWDRQTLRPVAPAIVWQDRRTAARCDELRSTHDAKRIRQKTGLIVDPYFSATKLEWLLAADPERRKRAESGDLAFGTIDTWLIQRLTGGAVHATDPTNASRTMLYDLNAGEWDADLCSQFGIPRAVLPEIRPSAGDFGVADPGILGAEVPICGVAGDQQAALFGQAGWTAGDAKNTYGTGAFLLLQTGARRGPDVPGVLTTAACGSAGEATFAYEGSILIAGAAVQWLRDGLELIESASETETLASSVEDSGGVLFVPALAGLGTPYWAADARGAVFGITRGTNKAHLTRAVLESIAHSTADVIDAMTGEQGVEFGTLRVDGGAARNDWLMQAQADLLGRPVIRPQASELTAIGAAGLAGIGAGLWEGPEELATARGGDVKFDPDPLAMEQIPARRREWKRAIDAVLGWTAEGRSE